MRDLKGEILASAAQGLTFLVGLLLSLVIGMVLAAHLDGAGGLLVATVISGAGLLAAAGFSQTLRDWLLDKRFAAR